MLFRSPKVDIDHGPTTTVATEAYISSPPGPPISVPISELIPVPRQFSSSYSGQGLETPPTVSDHAVLTFVVANHWSFSSRLLLPIVYYRPRCRNKISL